jgi:hypothetical protein
MPSSTSEPKSLKILILSCPKTGNTWLRWLLRYAYDIPIADVPLEWNQSAAQTLPDQFVSHQHLWPSEPLVRWIAENNVKVVTTIRHPGDALLSYFHYSKWNPGTAELDGARLHLDGERPGPHTLEFMRYGFAYGYSISLAWARLGALVVRFEDLLTSPTDELKRISDYIHPLPESRIRNAVLCCRPDRLTAPGLVDRRHLRTAGSGAWKIELPEEISSAMSVIEPFSTGCETHGYLWERGAPDPAAFDYSTIDPFRNATTFDNGESVGTHLPILYLHYIDGATARWPNPVQTQGDSFWNWLKSWAEADGANTASVTPRLTQLMHVVHESRRDLKEAFPDPYGSDRVAFANWFLGQACIELQLSRALIAPLEQQMLDFYQSLLANRRGEVEPRHVN